MSRVRGAKQSRKKAPATSSLMVRMDPQSKACVVQAAELRGMSVSDYVRTTTVVQARREVMAAHDQRIVLTPEEQLAFWKALNATPRLTEKQKELGAIARGEA